MMFLWKLIISSDDTYVLIKDEQIDKIKKKKLFEVKTVEDESLRMSRYLLVHMIGQFGWRTTFSDQLTIMTDFQLYFLREFAHK